MDPILEFLFKYEVIILFVVVLTEQIGIPIPAAPFILAAGSLAGGVEAWRRNNLPVETLRDRETPAAIISR